MATTTFKNNMVVTGALTVDGATTFTGNALLSGNATITGDATINGLTSAAVRAVVPTATGATTGLILATDSFVSVTSADAAHVIMLPAAPASLIGKVIRGWIGTTACEMRSAGAASTINGVTTITTNQALMTGTGEFTAKVVAAETWIVTYLTEAGVVTTITPDAIA